LVRRSRILHAHFAPSHSGITLKGAIVRKVLIALAVSLLSGFLVAQIIELLLLGLGKVVLTTSAIFWTTFFEATCLSLIIVHRSAFSARQVLGRGFLLGAVEWFALMLIGMFLFDGRPIMSTALMLFCLGGFALTRFSFRPSKAPT